MNRSVRFLTWLVLLLAATGLLVRQSEAVQPTLREGITQSADLQTFHRLLAQADLLTLLENHGPFTVLAPTDATFAALDAATLTALQQDPTLLRQTLLQHIVPGRYRTERMLDSGPVRSALGQDLTIGGSDPAVRIDNRATITRANQRVENGYLHAINGVLLPHGQNWLPPAPVYRPVWEPAPPPQPEPWPASIYHALLNEPQFSTLRQLVDTVSLVNLLSQKGTFTFFAPTNAAFEALSADHLRQLQNNTIARQVLLYHLAIGRHDAAALGGQLMLDTALNKPLTVDNLLLNGTARVTAPVNLNRSNGLVHGVDQLLWPPDTPFVVRETAPPPAGTVADVIARHPEMILFHNLMRTVPPPVYGDGPFTLFVPTNAALDNLPTGYLEALYTNHAMLKAMAGSHIVAGRHDLAGTGNLNLRTLAENCIAVQSADTAPLLNGRSVVVVRQIPATNGVIHLIDVALVNQPGGAGNSACPR
jgi:uncharacterized surface protein with fasciclin (FAS1) repeats